MQTCMMARDALELRKTADEDEVKKFITEELILWERLRAERGLPVLTMAAEPTVFRGSASDGQCLPGGTATLTTCGAANVKQ
jgi:hypothetical protein